LKAKLDFSKYSQIASVSSFDFSLQSSIGCGGKSAVAFYPDTVEKLRMLLQGLQADEVKYCVLGNLTNVLPPDNESDFVVVSMKKLNGITVGEHIFTYAGVMSGALLRLCKKEHRGGAEFLNGIPCTLGGALYMNAGAGGEYISEIVESVLVLRQGELQTLLQEECGYAYKKSIFMENGDVIVGASLRLKECPEEQIFKREQYFLQRRIHLPKGKSMGCVFKNPEGKSAGALIEGSGLKGLRIGGAKISTEHANFIINDGNATAKDIQRLITLAKNAVWAQYRIRLEEEIRYL